MLLFFFMEAKMKRYAKTLSVPIKLKLEIEKIKPAIIKNHPEIRSNNSLYLFLIRIGIEKFNK